MTLPAGYADLAKEPGPKMLVEALKLFGVHEMAGAANSPVIMGWAAELGLKGGSAYSGDDVPWCGLFMALIAHRAGKEPPASPLWALNWAKFGNAALLPMLGDVLVFKRDGGGHVSMYVGEDATHYHCLGGNQSDQVCITRIDQTRLYAARRPVYSIAQPANVRVIMRSAAGPVSTNEA